MEIYFAPMEGITTYGFRNAHAESFTGIHKYFTPFLVANQTGKFKKRELRDILPENNRGVHAVPQILSGKAEDFLRGFYTIADYGYKEINLNLGCSMPMVMSRGRGAALLSDPEGLDSFFEQVFEGIEKERAGVSLSVKTRIGTESPGEAEALLRVFNRYPLKELIVHPRLSSQLYRGTPDLEVFERILEEADAPVCYNGDIFSVSDAERLTHRFPALQSIMLGRGMLMDPSLARQICGGVPCSGEELRKYVKNVYSGYRSYMAGDMQVIPHMKEIWYYLVQRRKEEQGEEPKAYRKLRKTKTLQEYEEAEILLLDFLKGE